MKNRRGLGLAAAKALRLPITPVGVLLGAGATAVYHRLNRDER